MSSPTRIIAVFAAFIATMMLGAGVAAVHHEQSRCCFCESLPPSCMNGETYVPEKLKCVDGEWR